MKKAKVRKNVITHVWPKVKTLADGTVATKEMPDCYRGLNGKAVPDCIIDVPDEVMPGYVWNGKEYAKKIKKVIAPKRSDLLEVIAEKLGVPHDDLVQEIMTRKKARVVAAKKGRKSDPPRIR